MSDLTSLFRRAVAEFGSRLEAVTDDQWTSPTPDAEWDVRALVNHIVSEGRWAPPLLAGRTIAEVGDVFEGDLLGDDPKAAWRSASAEAMAAAAADGALAGTVHLSFGDFPAEGYLSQLICDHTIHAWDLAQAVGGDSRLDPELVAWVHEFLVPQAEQWRAGGAFGPAVEPPAGADLQTRLLALTGRAA